MLDGIEQGFRDTTRADLLTGRKDISIDGNAAFHPLMMREYMRVAIPRFRQTLIDIVISQSALAVDALRWNTRDTHKSTATSDYADYATPPSKTRRTSSSDVHKSLRDTFWKEIEEKMGPGFSMARPCKHSRNECAIYKQ